MATNRVVINTDYSAKPSTFTVAMYKNGVGSPEVLAGPFTDYSKAKAVHDAEKIRIATTTASGKKRTKQVFNTDEIPHLWMHKTQASARNAQGNVYFENETIYSYGSHFPIAKHVTNAKGKACILFTTDGYGNTTAKHISAVRSAIPDTAIVFNVSAVASWRGIDHASNLQGYVGSINSKVSKAIKARTNTEYLLNSATVKRNELKAYCKFFALKMPTVQMVPLIDSESIKAFKSKAAKLAAIQAAKTRKANEAERKLKAIQYMETIKTWMSEHLEYAARWDGTVENAEMLARELKAVEQLARELKALATWMEEHPEVINWNGTLE